MVLAKVDQAQAEAAKTLEETVRLGVKVCTASVVHRGYDLVRANNRNAQNIEHEKGIEHDLQFESKLKSRLHVASYAQASQVVFDAARC